MGTRAPAATRSRSWPPTNTGSTGAKQATTRHTGPGRPSTRIHRRAPPVSEIGSASPVCYPAPLDLGATGTVTGFGARYAGQIFVDWDNGRALILLDSDPFEILSAESAATP